MSERKLLGMKAVLRQVVPYLFALLFSLPAFGDLHDQPRVSAQNDAPRICHFTDLRELDFVWCRQLEPAEKAKNLVEILNRLRKKAPNDETERKIQETLIRKMEADIRAGRPIRLYMACFPAKSPNDIAKVLGVEADMAEELALGRLSEIIDKMNEIWPVEMSLASDGRMFADSFWASNDHVEAYQHGLLKLPKSKHITFRDLDTYYPGLTPLQARDRILEQYAPSLEEVKASMSPESNPDPDKVKERLILYQAFTRFMTGDANPLDREFYEPGSYTVDPRNPRLILTGHGEKKISRGAQEKIIKGRALEMMRRSDALNKLLLQEYVQKEGYIRLSIREQTETPEKIGVDLLRGKDQEDSATPWHTTIGLLPDKKHYLVLKRAEAEALGGKVVERNGVPYYFELPPEAEQNYRRMVPLIPANRKFWNDAPPDYIEKLADKRGMAEGHDLAAVAPEIAPLLGKKGTTVLEIGAGEGRTVDLVHKQYPGSQVVAIDYAEKHVKILQSKYKSDGKVRVIQQDVTNLNIGGKANVALWSGAGFIELGYGEKFEALKKIRDNLADDGKLVIDMPAKIPADYPIDEHGNGQIVESFGALTFQFLNEKDVIALANRAGFSRVKVITYKSGVGSERKSFVFQK